LKLFLLSMLFISALFAANAKDAALKLGAENNYSAAIEKAKAEKKMLVMVIVKENCRWCDKLLNRTLIDPEVKEELKNYITLIIDKNDKFPNDFKENFFPSMFYIDYKSGKSVYENIGFVGKKCFLNDLRESQNTRDELYK